MNKQNLSVLIPLSLICLCFSLLTSRASATTNDLLDPVINEFVVNHIGADTHEFIEIFGQPDTDYATLTAIQIEGDTVASQGSVLTVHPVGITDADGYWTTGYLNAQIQNGTLTLLLVEAYTGSVNTDLDTNNDGAFDVTPWTRIVDAIAITDGGSGDLTYTDIYTNAVLAANFDGFPTTPGGASRIPNGVNTFNADDWVRDDFDGAGLPGFTGTPVVGEAINTPGTINQAVAIPMRDLVINELDYNQPGTDTAEFIEIYNADTVAANLKDYAIQLVNGADGATYQSILLPDLALSAGSYFVVCANAANVLNCDLDVTPDTDLVQNGAPDAVALVLGNQIVDTVSYDGDAPAPYTEGSGVGLVDPGGVGDNYLGLSRAPNGLDTQQNNSDFGVYCITPGLANGTAVSPCTAPSNPKLVINEIDYDQPVADVAEFIELFNADDSPFDLGDFSLRLVNGANQEIYQTITLPSVSLNAGDYFVVCGDAARVVNCDLDVLPDTDLIQNGAPDAVALMIGDRVMDAVSYEGDVAPPYVEGSGVGLVDSATNDADKFKGISRFPNGTDTAVNNTDFSAHCITPGQANIAQTSACTDPGPTAVLTLRAAPTTVLEPGGPVTFTVRVTNTSAVSVTLTSLVDNMAGNLNGQGTCVIPQTLAIAGSYECRYIDNTNGSGGQVVTHTVTAVGQDAAAHTLSASQSVSVTIKERYLVYLSAVFNNFTSSIEEPNNVCEQAYPINIDQPYHFLANDSEDWYRFDLVSATTVVVRLTDFTPQLGQIVVYTGTICGSLTTLGNDGSQSTTKTVNLGLQPAGRYFVRVINDGAPNITTPYQLLIDTP